MELRQLDARRSRREPGLIRVGRIPLPERDTNHENQDHERNHYLKVRRYLLRESGDTRRIRGAAFGFEFFKLKLARVLSGLENAVEGL